MKILTLASFVITVLFFYSYFFIPKFNPNSCHFLNDFFGKVNKVDLSIFNGYDVFPSRSSETHPSYWEIKYEKEKGVSAFFNTKYDTVDMVRYNGKPENKAKYMNVAKIFTFLDINTLHSTKNELDIKLRGKHFLFYSRTKKVFPGNYIIGFKEKIYEVKDSVWFSDLNCKQ